MTYTKSPDSAASLAFEATAPTSEFVAGSGVYVAVDGDVEVVPSGQDASVTFFGARAGTVIPISVKEVVAGTVVPLGTTGAPTAVTQQLFIIVDGEEIFVDGSRIVEA